MKTTTTSRMGDVLLDSGRISPEQLELALKEQKQTGEKLGVVLQRLGILSEKEVGEILAGQAGVHHVSLSEEWFQEKAVELVPQEFAKEHRLMPISIRGKTLVLAMVNPMDLATIDMVSGMTGHYVEVVHATESDIAAAQLEHYGSTEKLDTFLQDSIALAKEALAAGSRSVEGDSPYVLLVDQIIRKGIDENATDIHIEPEEKVLRCRYRIDGRLVQGEALPKELQSIILTRFKIMAGMNISESRKPQDGRILFRHKGRKIDLRVSSFPAIHGESIVSRLLDKQNLSTGVEKLGMSKKMLKDFKQDISKPHGIILVTGPTGSGKTTTLYSALTKLTKPDVKTITLEDPVEYELPLISQGQIATKQGLTFASGLRAILRQDPDILLVGEIRDGETASMAIRAALTGHLVFSTLHTNDAVGVIPRLIDMEIEPFLLSATLVSVVAQRLVRSVCPLCRVEEDPTQEQTELLSLSEIEDKNPVYTVGSGCASCKDTGYSGRQAVFEYLRVTKSIRQLITENASQDKILETALGEGMKTLRDDTLDKVIRGKTSLDELMRVVS